MPHLLENVNYLDLLLALLEQTAAPIAVAPQSRGGLVLVSHRYSDLISPGSRLIWPHYFQCTGIYAVGAVQLCTLHSARARQHSFDNRIAGLTLIGRVLQDFDPLQRACLLVNLLCHRLGLGVVKQSNLELLGTLGRVQPDCIRDALNLYERNLQQLGQSVRLGDSYYLAWQRQLLSVVNVPLREGDLQALPLDPEVLVAPGARTQALRPSPQPELAFS